MKNMLATALILALVALLPSSPARAGEEKVDLRFRLEKGQEYKVLTTMEQEIVQWLQGNEMEVLQTIGIGQTLKVTDVDDKGAMTVAATFGPVAMKMEGPQGSFEFDSEDPPDEVPLAAQGMAAILGCSFTMKFTPKGKIEELTGVDEMLDKMFEGIELPDGELKDKMLEDMKKQFGADALKEMMENMMAMFPDKPVGVGDFWKQKVTITRGFPMVIESTYTLAGREDGVAELEVESTIEPNADAEPMKVGPMSMKFKLKGTQEGTLKINEATGWFVEGKMTQEMEGETIISGAPGQGEEMSIPMRIKSTITFETE
jgi:hypothetical protein